MTARRAACIFLSVLIFHWAPSQADPPQGYYAGAAGRAGTELRVALHAIVDGHVPLTYTNPDNRDWQDGNAMDVWEAIVYTDSPCPADEPRCGLVQLFYLNEPRSIRDADRNSGGWVREHVFPAVRGFPYVSQHAHTDLHHLVPVDRAITNIRSDHGYDEGGEPVRIRLADGTTRNTGARVDRDHGSFEPPDSAKGRVARMLFYMAVRYGPAEEDGEERTPDLRLVDRNEPTGQGLIGDLCTLLKWHNQHPPTEFEHRRNDRIFELQGNRNPFIDVPVWAPMIWGGKCDYPA